MRCLDNTVRVIMSALTVAAIGACADSPTGPRLSSVASTLIATKVTPGAPDITCVLATTRPGEKPVLETVTIRVPKADSAPHGRTFLYQFQVKLAADA